MRPRTVSDDEILDAARVCLFAHGPAATVDEIARRVGVSGPAVLKRFGTKDKLVARALLSEAPPDLSHGPEPGPLAPQLTAVLLHLERVVREVAPRLGTMRAGGGAVSRSIPVPPPKLGRQSLLSWLERARDSHDLSHRDLASAADLLVGLVEARSFLIWIDPTWVDADDAWAARAVAALFPDLPARLAPRRGSRARARR